jgi:hypothetical protein
MSGSNPSVPLHNEALSLQADAEVRRSRLEAIERIGARRVLYLDALPCWTGQLVGDLDFPWRARRSMSS